MFEMHRVLKPGGVVGVRSDAVIAVLNFWFVIPDDRRCDQLKSITTGPHQVHKEPFWMVRMAWHHAH